MEITTRQREFLKVLINLYQEKGSPIHYSDVAKKMLVSKWTAYDMLHLLYQKKFLQIEYITRESFRNNYPKFGRSLITFSPTRKGYLVSNQNAHVVSSKTTDLNKLKENIIKHFNELKGTFNIKDLLKEALQTKSPLLFCACLLLILILLIKKITEGLAEIKLISQIIPADNTNTYIGLALVVFVGMCLGILSKYINKIPNFIADSPANLDDYIHYVQVYNQYISQMDEKEQKSLLSFLREALEEINRRD